MAKKTYPIRGISTGIHDGRVPIRREFSEWIESKDENDRRQVILFFFALDYFQKVDPADRDSYFQIAGESDIFCMAFSRETYTNEASMAIRMSLGTRTVSPRAKSQVLATREEGTVCTPMPCFQYGIGPIFFYTRWVLRKHSLRAFLLTKHSSNASTKSWSTRLFRYVLRTHRPSG